MEDRHDKTDKFKIQAFDTITSPSTEKQSAQLNTWFCLCTYIVIRVPLIADSTNPAEQSPSLEVSSSSDNEKCPAFWSRRFITVFTTAHHVSQS